MAEHREHNHSGSEPHHHHHHHRLRHAWWDFQDGVGNFFYRLFRPARHFFRWLAHSFARMNDKIAYLLDKRAQKNYERQIQREKNANHRVGNFFYRLFRPARHFFRWLARSSEQANDIIAQQLDKIEDKNIERQIRIEETAVHSANYLPALERLRILLLFLMCINLFGLPTVVGSVIQSISSFVPIAFFILSGFLVLRESENRSARIARSIKRTALVFLIMAVVYFLLNFFYYRLLGVNIIPVFASKRFWFNFVVLNVWQFDIGSAIWYVQALLYAYIIIFILDKLKLLKFDWLISALFILLTIFTGELTGIFKWNVLGYTYIPGNFFTRALPYVLLGGFIRRKLPTFAKIRHLFYWIGIVFGSVLVIAEPILLAYFGVPGYYGHLIGMPIVAVSVCMLAFLNTSPEPGFEEVFGISRQHLNCIYYFCQPMGIGLALLLSTMGGDVFVQIIGFISIITFLVGFLLAWLFSYISKLHRSKKAGIQEVDDQTAGEQKSDIQEVDGQEVNVQKD